MATKVQGQSFIEKKNEILKAYGLDFNITKTELQANILTDDGGILVVPSGYYGLYNDKSKTIINTVKEGYRVSQTEEVVAMVLKGIEGFGELSVTKGGSIHDGRKVYLQLQIDGLARVGNDDLKRYITIIDSNDGSTGLSVGISDKTMSCQNQFFKFYKAGEMKAKHTGSLSSKMMEFPHLITLALSNQMQLLDAYKTFTKTKASQELVHQLVKNLLGNNRLSDEEITPRALSNMNKLYENIEHEMFEKGNTIWGLHSGVTRWTTHDKQAPNRPNGRMESLITGTNYKTNQQSLDFALKQCNLELSF